MLLSAKTWRKAGKREVQMGSSEFPVPTVVVEGANPGMTTGLMVGRVGQVPEEARTTTGFAPRGAVVKPRAPEVANARELLGPVGHVARGRCGSAMRVPVDRAGTRVRGGIIEETPRFLRRAAPSRGPASSVRSSTVSAQQRLVEFGEFGVVGWWRNLPCGVKATPPRSCFFRAPRVDVDHIAPRPGRGCGRL